jgi:hypothetical protein
MIKYRENGDKVLYYKNISFTIPIRTVLYRSFPFNAGL